MRIITRIIAAMVAVGVLAAPAGAQPPTASPLAAPKPAPRAASFKITDNFTAQRRPRVTVLTFEDTNKEAQRAKYGAAVEAMLVTFLKRKSQFVVVERQKINTILSEKERLQTGMVETGADDDAAQALLEKIDVFVLGSVTLLDLPGQARVAQPTPEKADAGNEYSDDEKGDAKAADARPGFMTRNVSDGLPESGETTQKQAEKWEDIGGATVEVDAKLISRFDGRIIAAAQRSGPVACLRSIVERLGVALEQEFLRPYYGTLTVTLDEPEHVRLFLTPILPSDALDEEKPPVERSATVVIGGERDTVQPWTTDPTTYTIRSLLNGWYSMRIERPGYTGFSLENARWEVRNRQGKQVVYDRVSKLPLDKIPFLDRRFVVQVTPLTTDVLDLKSLRLVFEKESGSLTPLAKRQYIDTDYSRGPSRAILLGGPQIDLNRIDGPGEYADDPKCDLFVEETPHLANYGRTYVTAGQPFSLDQFTGGELIIEDYKGEAVPVGRYTMVLWEPSYQLETTQVTVRNNDKSSLKMSLVRETAKLQLGATGPRPASHALLTGETTGYEIRLPLDFSHTKELPGVPVDRYTAGTDITELKLWNHGVEVPATNLTSPSYDTTSKKNEPWLLLQAVAPQSEKTTPPFVGIKTRFGIAGRLRALSRKPDPLAADLFIEQDIAKILNLLLYGVATRPGDEEERPNPQVAVVQAGQDLLTQTSFEVNIPGGPSRSNLALRSQAFVRRDRGTLPQKNQPQTQATDDEVGQDGGTGNALGTEKPGESGKDAPDKPAPPKPDPFPKDLEALRNLLATRLEMIDLLVLDPVDMVQLRQSPETARVIARWVSAGGSLFAFVSSPGDYLEVVGAPLRIEDMSKRTKRFNLAPGKVAGLVHATKKKVKSKGRRQLPELTDLDSSWRVLAVTQEGRGRGPRIIDRGSRGPGGYVVLWFDDPETFRGRWGGTRPEVEQTRANVEEHVFKWARDRMRSRFAASAEPQSPASPTGH